MDGEKNKKKALESETFDLYETIRPTVEEFLDEWFIVGIRPGCGSRILVAVNIKVGTDQLAYDAIKKWKKENLFDYLLKKFA